MDQVFQEISALRDEFERVAALLKDRREYRMALERKIEHVNLRHESFLDLELDRTALRVLKLKLDDLRLQQRLRSELLESRRGDLASLEKEYRQLETFEIQLRSQWMLETNAFERDGRGFRTMEYRAEIPRLKKQAEQLRAELVQRTAEIERSRAALSALEQRRCAAEQELLSITNQLKDALRLEQEREDAELARLQQALLEQQREAEARESMLLAQVQEAEQRQSDLVCLIADRQALTYYQQQQQHQQHQMFTMPRHPSDA